ncbi:MAG: hypothetical protein ABH864_01795 [archaeon]
MRVKEREKKEIEQRIMEMNDYLRIEYLKGCLKNQLDFDTRKFVLVKLAGLYETKSMMLEAGRMMRSAAEINTSQGTKVTDFIKAMELFIRGGDYDLADIVRKKVLALADANRREEIDKTIREYYKIQARVCIEGNKRKQAVGVYEKLLTMQLDDLERKELQEVLLGLYEAVGDFGKHRSLKRKMSIE